MAKCNQLTTLPFKGLNRSVEFRSVAALWLYMYIARDTVVRPGKQCDNKTRHQLQGRHLGGMNPQKL